MTDFLFNIDGGYLEGLCRGFKCGILKQPDYLNLVQCETLEGSYYSLQFFSHFFRVSFDNGRDNEFRAMKTVPKCIFRLIHERVAVFRMHRLLVCFWHEQTKNKNGE